MSRPFLLGHRPLTQTEKNQRWLANHPEYHSQYRLAHPNRNEKWYQARKDLIIQEKSKSCVDCGIRYYSWQMDFDHVRGQKLFNIGTIKTSLKKLKEEIAKCDVVCANCHRQRTHDRGYNNQTKGDNQHA